VVKVSGLGGGAQPPAPIWASPCNSIDPPWLNLQSAILRLNKAKLVGLEWVCGLIQPGFVRWAPPPASQNHFNHWGHSPLILNLLWDRNIPPSSHTSPPPHTHTRNRNRLGYTKTKNTSDRLSDTWKNTPDAQSARGK